MFQSTRPVWGATQFCHVGRCLQRGFNPRAPCGARLFGFRMQLDTDGFQSTRPVWGATGELHGLGGMIVGFNPRAPCGARPFPFPIGDIPSVFQSTRPVWGATLKDLPDDPNTAFQSTRPVWGATAKEVTTSLLCHVFMCIPLHKYDFLGT